MAKRVKHLTVGHSFPGGKLYQIRGVRKNQFRSNIIVRIRKVLQWLDNKLSAYDWSDSEDYDSWDWTKPDGTKC
jgi:hypothetical protein